jgi:hypothetical protein
MNLYKKIIINNWTNNKNYTTHEINVYEDDNLENAIVKLAKSIYNTNRFYVWKGNVSILFNFNEIKWDGYSANPLTATHLKSKQLKEPVIYNYNGGLFPYTSINIIFEKNFPELKNNPYYFTDKSYPILSQIISKENILKSLEIVDTKPIIDTTTNIHKYELTSKLTKHYELVELFEKLNTNDTIQFIQWINDNYKIIYKLYKYNKLTKEKFVQWTDIKKIASINCINCYSILNTGTYAKLTINQDMSIILSYTINLRKNINWIEIKKNIKEITEYCISYLNHKLLFDELSIKANIIFEIENVAIKNLKKKLSEFVDIFDILKSNKDTINLIYKRSSNYNKQGFDAHLYVKNCLFLGLDEEDIINQLVILNNDISIQEAKDLLKTEQELIYEMEQQNIKQQDNVINKINTIVIIEVYKTGFLINIINIPNKKELENIIYWLSKIISSAVQKPTTQSTKKQTIIRKSPSPSSPSSSIENDESKLGKLSFSSSSSSSSSSFSGGALGKEKHSYFINLLQKADKDLFQNNYARTKCQAVNQPIVFTQEYKKILEKNGNYHVDNDLIYGSKPDIKNVYACPRRWCPQSKIPLDPNDPDAKCPIDNEEPMEMYFDKDPNKKRFVKLIKPDENNICVPCCFKKPPKPDELNKCKYYNDIPAPVEVVANKDENYLVNTSPIEVGRYGAIPQSLHELLFPTVKFTLCSKMLNKTDKCLVRRGITHKTTKKIKNAQTDSIINAVAYGLNFKSKEEFINDIIKKLDLITFMSLENGNVCKAFIDKLPIIPENNKKMVEELNEHLIKFKLNTKIQNIDNINYKLSRLLSIFNSYKKFIEYLRSNDYPTGKSPYFLYSLISILYNILLVIWEKQGETTSIVCPYYTSFEDLIGSMELNNQILMLLKEKHYYEPIELKLKGVEGEKLINLNEYKHIKKLFKECSILKNNYNENYSIFNNIYSLNTWVKSSLLKIKEKFIITSVVINNDLSITHFITREGFFIITDKISISFLNRIIIDLDIIEILFYDDIIGNSIDINVIITDYNLFIEQCKVLNINYDFGDLTNTTKKEYYYNLIVKKLPLTNDIIHSQIIDDLYRYQVINKDKNKKWYQLQLMIYLKLLNLPDEKFNYLLSLNKEERIIKLFKELKLETNPEKSKLRIILEETPFISKKHIKKFLNDFIIYFKYDFLNPIIKESKHQFLFSQVAIQREIPPKLLIYHPSTPNITFNTFDSKEYTYNKNDITEEIILPKLFTGPFEKLNSKWVMHKKSKWSNMMYIKNDDNYNRHAFKELYLWLAGILNIKTTYADLENAAINEIQQIFSSKDYEAMKPLIKDIFDDPYFNKLLAKAIGKKYTNYNIFWDKYYNLKTIDEHKDLLRSILTTANEPLFPNDYYIICMCRILNINIINIHRSKYGNNDKQEPVVRGDVEDLLLSSTFYKAPTINYENRPLLILYKYNISSNIVYNIIVDSTITPIGEKSIYMRIKDIPQAIKYLIEEHLKIKIK